VATIRPPMATLSFQIFEAPSDAFKKLIKTLHTLTKTMSVLVTRLATVLEYLTSKDAEQQQKIAELSEALAAALANDAADAETIAAAQADAEAAKAVAADATAKVAELQALADADATEDAAITALLDAVSPPGVEPAPVLEDDPIAG